MLVLHNDMYDKLSINQKQNEYEITNKSVFKSRYLSVSIFSVYQNIEKTE
jgi:uncharacterized membrane protein YjgN (DUF898 family)